MAFTSPITAVSGNTFTAAQFNTSVRDNLNAIFVGTTAGDLDYYTSSTAKARVAIGAEYKFWQVNAGATAPEWGGLQFCTVYSTATQSISSGGSPTVLTFNAELSDVPGWHSTSVNTNRITVTKNGLYVPFVTIYWVKDAGGSGTFEMRSSVRLNGTDTANRDFRIHNIDANAKVFTFGGIPVSMTATQYLDVSFYQDSGGTGTIYGSTAENTVFSVLRIA